MRKTLSGIVAGLIAAAALAFVPAPAQAAEQAYYAPTGDFHLVIPHKVVVNEPYEDLDFAFTGQDAGHLVYACVYLEHVSTTPASQIPCLGDANHPRLLTDTTGVFQFWNTNPMGDYTAMGWAMVEGKSDDFPAPVHLTVKLAAANRLTAARHGSYVTLRSTSTQYGIPAWTPDQGATVRFQRHYNGHWHTFATRTTGKTGVVKATIRRTTRANYRAVTYKTDTTWGTKSRALTK